MASRTASTLRLMFEEEKVKEREESCGNVKERQQSFPLSARRRPSRVRARAQIAVDFTDLHISSSNKILKVSRHFAPSTTCSGRSGVLTIFAVRCR